MAALPHADRLPMLLVAAQEAVEHFEIIERSAEHWRAVVQNNEIAEARWAAIRNHARHRAKVLRNAIAEAREP